MGDSLGDDDAYFLEPVVGGGSDDDFDNASIDEPLTAATADNDATQPRKKQKLDNEALLIQAGLEISTRPLRHQRSFLDTSLRHYAMLAAATEKGPHSLEFHLKEKNFGTSSKETLAERIRDIVSMKRLKNHKETRSPAILVVCLSARRAVAVLKELGALRLRAAKLFPKSGEVQQQVTMLRQSPYALAVGTPHRLLALCGQQKGLTLEHTQLVVLDSFVSNKQFTVCTLPDTAPDTISFLREAVLPQFKTNKSLRLAFL